MNGARHHHEEATIHDRHTSTSFTVRVPASDIHACLGVPLWFALLSAVSVLLAITDIPRSGLAFTTRDYYNTVGPGITTYWGPYEYHTVHLAVVLNGSSDSTREPPTITGSCDGKELASVSVWSYKQDTLSIAPRAVADHLGVTSYPSCVLYRQKCATPELDFATVFTMLNDLVQSIQVQLFQETHLESHPFTFATKSNWVDRLHHHLVRTFSQNADVRVHSVYHISSRRNATQPLRMDARHLCGNRTTRPFHSLTFSSEARPLLCDFPIQWMAVHPTNPTAERRVPLWDHIAIRFDDLQRRYKHLELDFTMFSTTLEEQSQSNTHVVTSASFVTDTLEITTLIRGRRCDSHGNCTTEFIDDYRYERSDIESDESRSRYYVSGLRGLSQVYVWIRIALLCVGCYRASCREPAFLQRRLLGRLAAVITTLSKIPGHTVVYGSWFPLIGYSLAHFFDSSLVQAVAEYAWASVGGFYAFNPVEYVITASIQMRNVWMIALIWKLIFTVHTKLFTGRLASRSTENLGVLAFRGGWIGVVSWLTTFGLMRALHFRDTNTVSLLELPRHSTTTTVHGYRNYSDYGYQFDLKCSFLAFVLVCSAGWIIQVVIQFTTGQASSIFFCRSFYVPHSAGTLWSWSALDTFWLVRFRCTNNGARVYIDPDNSFASPSPRRKSSSPAPTAPTCAIALSQCRVCSFKPSMLHWRSAQGCPKHEPIFDVHRRTKALWSMVRLMNIANMTDPIALFRLYVTGRTLYVYRIHSKHQPPYSLLLPMRVGRSDDTDPTKTVPRWAESRLEVTGDGGASSFELVRTVDSRDVPWHVLVNCG